MSDERHVFKPGDVVAYVPFEVRGDSYRTEADEHRWYVIKAEDVEYGVVSSVNQHGHPWVRFTRAVYGLGFKGTTGQMCNPDDLVVLYHRGMSA